MDVEKANEISTEVLEACTLEGGKLTLGEEQFLAFGARIRDAEDKQGWATALIALVQRLRGVQGAGAAAERITALAALALGDADVGALLKRERKGG